MFVASTSFLVVLKHGQTISISLFFCSHLLVTSTPKRPTKTSEIRTPTEKIGVPHGLNCWRIAMHNASHAEVVLKPRTSEGRPPSRGWSRHTWLAMAQAMAPEWLQNGSRWLQQGKNGWKKTTHGYLGIKLKIGLVHQHNPRILQ